MRRVAQLAYVVDLRVVPVLLMGHFPQREVENEFDDGEGTHSSDPIVSITHDGCLGLLWEEQRGDLVQVDFDPVDPVVHIWDLLVLQQRSR